MRREWTVVLAISLLAGCVSQENVRVDLRPYAAAATEGRSPAAQPVRVRVDPVEDARKDAVGGLVGEKTTFGQPMGFIELRPAPTSLVASVLRAELAAAGHDVVEAGERFRLHARLLRFAVATPATALYWDVNGDVEVELVATGSGGARYETRLVASCSGRTYTGPDGKIIASVVTDCLAELGGKFRADPALQRFLAGG